MTNKLRSKPPTASAEGFISGADRNASVMEQPELQVSTKRAPKSQNMRGRGLSDHPWEDPMVRDDMLKIYNLRLPEPYLLKLKYIAKHTPGSMHQFCIEVLLPAIDKKVKELT